MSAKTEAAIRSREAAKRQPVEPARKGRSKAKDAPDPDQPA